MLKEINLSNIIPLEHQGKRLDQALACMFPQFSRMRIKEWIDSGMVLVNGNILKPRDKILGEETVEIKAELEEKSQDLPQKIALDIVAEEAEFLVINKPPYITVHPGTGNPNGTLLNALLNYDESLSLLPRAGIVHRLDKDTSGLMVVARTLAAHTALVRQLQERTVKRTYEAVVTGTMTAGTTINERIGRHPKDRKKMAVTPTGKISVTHYRVVQKFRAHTHIKVELETGRTHQIRVHMAHSHYPLVGDKTYGGRFKLPPKISVELQDLLRNFPRQALHAKKLGFLHPITEEYLEWKCPTPDDLSHLIKMLQADNKMNGFLSAH